MQPNAERGNGIGGDPRNNSPSTFCSEPWWRNTGYNSTGAMVGGNASISSALEQYKDGQAESGSGPNEEDGNCFKESQATASPCSDGSYGPDKHNSEKIPASMPPRNDEKNFAHPQLELVGHSIQACASNPYFNPYYGGMVAAYGPQPLVHPHLYDMQQARMALPLEVAQEPVYVNAKQYPGILRRRQSRAKAELERKLIKDRKPYLHESRHQHAMRRARSSGGRFAKKSEIDASQGTKERNGTGSAMSSQSASSSGSEPLPSDSAGSWSSHREMRGSEEYLTREAHGYGNNSNQYADQSNFHAPIHVSRAGKGGEGESSGQQRGSTSSGNASRRGLTF